MEKSVCYLPSFENRSFFVTFTLNTFWGCLIENIEISDAKPFAVHKSPTIFRYSLFVCLLWVILRKKNRGRKIVYDVLLYYISHKIVNHFQLLALPIFHYDQAAVTAMCPRKQRNNKIVKICWQFSTKFFIWN